LCFATGIKPRWRLVQKKLDGGAAFCGEATSDCRHAIHQPQQSFNPHRCFYLEAIAPLRSHDIEEMIEFMDYVQNAFYSASLWDHDNSYSTLTATANGNHTRCFLLSLSLG